VDDRLTHVWTLRDGWAIELRSFARHVDAVRGMWQSPAERRSPAQYLAARQIDGLRLHVVPVLLGAGERLFGRRAQD
jgi:hypothetical protein